jgi:hypothetical protein
MYKNFFLLTFLGISFCLCVQKGALAGKMNQDLIREEQETTSVYSQKTQWVMNAICKFLYSNHTNQSNVTTNYLEGEENSPHSLELPQITLNSKPLLTKEQDSYYFYKISKETGNILIYVPSSMIGEFTQYITLYQMLGNNEKLHFESFVMADPAVFHIKNSNEEVNSVTYLAFVNRKVGAVIFAGPEENLKKNIDFFELGTKN